MVQPWVGCLSQSHHLLWFCPIVLTTHVFCNHLSSYFALSANCCSARARADTATYKASTTQGLQSKRPGSEAQSCRGLPPFYCLLERHGWVQEKGGHLHCANLASKRAIQLPSAA